MLTNIEKAYQKNVDLEQYYRRLGFDILADHCKDTAAALNEALTIIRQLTEIPSLVEEGSNE